MSASLSTRQCLDDHLGQAEFALKVVANFDCLKGTPAHESVCAALAQVSGAREWVRVKLPVHGMGAGTAELAYQTPAERYRLVRRRMAKLVP